VRNAYGYLRVSSNGQVEGDGFPRQREAIKTYATAHDIRIVKWFEEKGVSGTLLERPALSEMMIALMSDGLQLVVVEKLDRLARDQMVQETIIQTLLKQGYELASAHSGEENLCGTDPGRKLMRTIMGAIAEYDKMMLVLKLKASRQRAKAKTGRCEGRKPFSRTPTEQATIKRMRELAKQGFTYSAVAVALNSESHATQTGSVWFPATVSRTLNRRSK